MTEIKLEPCWKCKYPFIKFKDEFVKIEGKDHYYNLFIECLRCGNKSGKEEFRVDWSRSDRDGTVYAEEKLANAWNWKPEEDK